MESVKDGKKEKSPVRFWLKLKTGTPGERIRRFFFLLLNGILLTGKFPFWAGTVSSLKATYNSISQNNQTHLHPDVAARNHATEKEA